MSGENPVKMGIVGLGRWAKVLTNAAKKSDKLQIIAGHSRTQEKREAFTQQFGINTYRSLAEILAMPDIEGVIITVPNEQHFAVAKQIAEAGKHVYTEKPILRQHKPLLLPRYHHVL